MIYLTSDTHFGHLKDFIWRPRGFKLSIEHDQTIIERWNKLVQPEDEVYHLGDVMLGDNVYGCNCVRQLNGHIHVVLGNHDTDMRRVLYRKMYNIVEVDKAIDLKYKGYKFHLTHYPTLTANHDDGKALKNQIINLCGHLHTKDAFEDWQIGTIYHVELDAHDCEPMRLDDIITAINNKDKRNAY